MMTPRFSRRSLLAGAGAVASALVVPVGQAEGAAPPVRPRRRSASPYLSGNYAPVAREVTATVLPVTGRLPLALSGHLIRNGPNPIAPRSYHYSWFGGDGMLHVIEFDEGRVRSYRNRWVRTPAVAAALGEADPGGPASPTGVDLSNTSTARLGSSLLSLTESALPYSVTTEGATIGRVDLDGGLTHGLSAHAKHDPIAGEVHQVGYRVGSAPYAVWQVIDEGGQVTRTLPLDLPQPVMIHNATLTGRHLLVYDLPVVFSSAAVSAGWSVPFAWDANHVARVGVIDRASGAVRWIEIDPTFVFHDAGSHDTGTGLEVDLVTYPKVFDGDLGGPLSSPSRLERWSVDLASGSIVRTVLDDRPQEFPRIAPSQFDRANRFTYVVGARSGTAASALDLGNALLRHDHARETTASWSPGRSRSVAEAVFVADPERSGYEDGGWLLAFVYDARSDGSSLVVLDAQDLAAGPIATVALPQRVPAGFHGNWFARI